MRALCFDGVLGLHERPIPQPAEGQARVRVRLAGLCGTDLQIVRGYAGHHGVLGHEFVGEVEHHDDPSWIGRRVVAEINVGCGGCEACARGLRAHCATRRVIGIREHDGAFAPFVLVPHENLHVVPDHVDDRGAVFVEPLAAAFEILEQVVLTGGSRVAVIGDGRLGLLVAMVLVDRGCDVTIVGRHPRKLAIAAGLGARTELGDDATARSHDCVVEATGAADGFTLAQRMIRPRGTIVLKSTTHGTTPIALASIVVDEITVVGSRCGPFAPAIAALDRLDPRVLVDDVFALGDGVRAFARAAEPGVLKVLLDMGAEP